MSKKRFIIGIDIGGGHVDGNLYQINHNKTNLLKKPVYEVKISKDQMKKDLNSHVIQIADLIHQLSNRAKKLNGEINGIGIGSPGRFDLKGKIKRGTNTNFGSTPDEFDNVNLQDLYSKKLEKRYGCRYPLYVGNDGDAMLLGIINEFLELDDEKFQKQVGITKEEFQTKTISSLTIGTGVGNSYFKYIDSSWQRVNDGHASKIVIPVEIEDYKLFFDAWQRIEKNETTQEIFYRDVDGLGRLLIRSEDLMRGPFINALAGVLHGKDIDLNNIEHLKALKFAGKYIAQLIVRAYGEESEDINKENGWNAKDKEEASKAEIYFIGGGVGRSNVGKKIIEYATQELKSHAISHIKLLQDTTEHVMATYSAAKFVPEDTYRAPSNNFVQKPVSKSHCLIL